MQPPRIHLAILWHQHQPYYGDRPEHGTLGGCFPVPWVRLHALRDYYSMAALVAQYPEVHLTINLTPVLLRQLEDYVERNWTDVALELTRTPTASLTTTQRETIATRFFEADWHHEIYPHARYKELFDRRGQGIALDDRDFTDLRMWFNLAWFAPEFQCGEAALPDGSIVSVRRFVEKASDFNEDDVSAMVAEQFKILRNVVGIHRNLQDAGQIEVSTTPFYHPILPLLHDSDSAILDRDGTSLPGRFAYPEDASAQIEKSVAYYTRLFGRRPSGMWPAEGAVGESVIEHFRQHGLSWIATDQGVLTRSGEYGYEARRPELLAKAWRAGSDDCELCVSVFFRDSELSDAIGFRYGHMEPELAVDDFIGSLKRRFLADGQERIVSVILDGENAWGSYEQGGRPFIAELYHRLSGHPEIRTVTFSEWLKGAPTRGIPPHPLKGQERVCRLAHASWIDEYGSQPGNDLGTWIGETEENTAWDLLRETREALQTAGVTSATNPQSFDALYAAEGSDWFWWYGDDQHCDAEQLFDGLFRQHLRTAYELASLPVPRGLGVILVPRAAMWSFLNQVPCISPRDQFRFQAGCSGILTWYVEGRSERQEIALTASGGVMAGLNSYSATVGPFGSDAQGIGFQFRCGCAEACHCRPEDLCCNGKWYTVRVAHDDIGENSRGQLAETKCRKLEIRNTK